MKAYKKVLRTAAPGVFTAIRGGFRFELGKTYCLPEDTIAMRFCGFHAWADLTSCCVGHYGYSRTDPVVEVNLSGKTVHEGMEWVASCITIVRELSGDEIARVLSGRARTFYRSRVEYLLDGYKHREGDLPAVVHATGGVEYWRNGLRHRDGDLPAVVHATGYVEYWKNGVPHRDGDLPAVIRAPGGVYWNPSPRSSKRLGQRGGEWPTGTFRGTGMIGSNTQTCTSAATWSIGNVG